MEGCPVSEESKKRYIFFKNLVLILFSLKGNHVLFPGKHLHNKAMHCEEWMPWLMEAEKVTFASD